MTYSISKDFEFSASHVLDGLPLEHPCSRLHGHNYKVRVILSGSQLDSRGFLVDYRELAPFKTSLDRLYDHRHLNDVVPYNPTAENLARGFSSLLLDLLDLPQGVRVSVSVSETPKTWATFEGRP